MTRPARPPLQPGQEWVWDYPRPPRLEGSDRRLRVVFGGIDIADTTEAYRVLETSHPPVYYIPRDDIRMQQLVPAGGGSFCEWKGSARYFGVRVGERTAPKAAWSYPDPAAAFADIRDHIAFYPALMDACYLGEQRVEPQPGGFYGGWITPGIIGFFKGPPGTACW
jgi:uncharacterized protein (DUF427 family)